MTSIWWYCLDVLFGHGRTQGLAPTCLYEALQPKSQNPGAAALSCGEGLDRDSRRARKTALALDQTWREWSAQSNSWNLGTEITQNCVDDENLTVVLVIHGLFTKVQGFWPISVSQSVERKIACLQLFTTWLCLKYVTLKVYGLSAFPNRNCHKLKYSRFSDKPPMSIIHEISLVNSQCSMVKAPLWLFKTTFLVDSISMFVGCSPPR